MGLNICVQNPKTFEDVPEWNWLRTGGDREFAAIAGNLPSLQRPRTEARDEDVIYFRPADFAAWRKAIADADIPNRERFDGLMNLLENEPGYWLYFSY